MAAPPNVRTLKELVRWIAHVHHHGSVNAITQRVSLSSALLGKYANGRVKYPRIDSLTELAKAYDLEPDFVIGLAYPSLRRPVAGGSGTTDNFPPVEPKKMKEPTDLRADEKHYVNWKKWWASGLSSLRGDGMASARVDWLRGT
jgi:transcriptional regulator with XRE-family HTH domain